MSGNLWMSRGIETILENIVAKRVRQIAHHGYTFEHDDKHDCGELAVAAIPYIQAAYCELTPEELQVYWPWDEEFKPAPTDTKRELLLNAAALLVAEIERLDRAEGR